MLEMHSWEVKINQEGPIQLEVSLPEDLLSFRELIQA
jgi:hypothetical protein